MRKSVLAIAVVSSIAVPAFAENNLNPFEDEKSGFYLGLGAGAADYKNSYSDYEDDVDGYGFGKSEYTYRDLTVNLFAGYRVNKYFGLEVNYSDLGRPDAEWKSPRGSEKEKVENEIKGYGIKAVGFYPINNSFELKASVGVMKWKVEEDYSETSTVFPEFNVKSSESKKGSSLTVGLGANYNLTDNIAFGLQWERINDVGEKYDENKNDTLRFGETDIDLYTLSAQYKF
ncbi:outer membrane beta-barrel protein [Endozoicomonas sp. SM1973]|uniref:Outer membrane beta-barrel protein n=1 Tax=Spartinivicinus marinus TaxID=2994442 RepID=A0A853IER1_9GAMM|nr:outer membrane beta-barrel protein [Spartinivicinus marinus]MCX4027253.1 outer membrane beta-barrel protein [Spartinivicinus marinus]NYZ67987.1 outer membrane beta-barrel protein [Spartinivicinus marinus]